MLIKDMPITCELDSALIDTTIVPWSNSISRALFIQSVLRICHSVHNLKKYDIAKAVQLSLASSPTKVAINFELVVM